MYITRYLRIPLHPLQEHFSPSQFLIIFLKASKFSQHFKWLGNEFQTLGPNDFKLFVPKVVWLGCATFRLFRC